MARIYNENLWPDGGWFFIDASGVRHSGTSFRALVNVVAEYRARAGFEPGDPTVEVTEQVCSRQPEFCHAGVPRQVPLQVTSPIPRNYISTLAQKVSSWISTKFADKRMGKVQRVGAAEARRRESICARCPKQHAFPSSCGPCLDNVNRLAGEVIPGEPLNHGIKCCSALAEWTPVSVWLDEPQVADDGLPAECWKKSQ